MRLRLRGPRGWADPAPATVFGEVEGGLGAGVEGSRAGAALGGVGSASGHQTGERVDRRLLAQLGSQPILNHARPDQHRAGQRQGGSDLGKLGEGLGMGQQRKHDGALAGDRSDRGQDRAGDSERGGGIQDGQAEEDLPGDPRVPGRYRTTMAPAPINGASTHRNIVLAAGSATKAAARTPRTTVVLTCSDLDA